MSADNTANPVLLEQAARFTMILPDGVDPTVTAVEASKGTVAIDLTNGQTYQKQDDGASINWGLFAKSTGASGEWLGRQLADPGGATAGDGWILVESLAVAPTFITTEPPNGTGSPDGTTPSLVALTVPAPSISDLLGLSFNAGGSVITIQWNPLAPGNVITINATGGSWLIDYETSVTVQDMVDAINTFSQARIGKNIASVGGHAAAGADFDTEINGIGVFEAFLMTDGKSEKGALRYQTPDGPSSTV